MTYQVKIFLSKQANLLLDNMPSINQEDLIKWFCTERKISIGGGDVIDYLNTMNGRKVNG